MAAVVLERTVEDRVTGAQLLDMDRRNRWCFRAHGIRPRGHLVSRDGLRFCCVLDAPDAESVRLAGRRAELPLPDRIWPAETYGPVPGMERLSRPSGAAERALVVVERSFAEPVRFDDVQAVEDRGAWCLSLNRVAFLVSWVALDGRRAICLYDAPDAESVGRSNARLGLPFDRVWSADLYVCEERAGPQTAE